MGFCGVWVLRAGGVLCRIRTACGAGFLELANDAGGVSGGENGLGDVFGDDAAGTDDGAGADADAGAEDRPAADPDVVADFDGFGEFEPLCPFVGTHRVGGGVDLDAGADQHAAADTNGGDIEENAIEVEVHVIAEGDIAAVIAEKRRLDPEVLAGVGEQLAQEAAAEVGLVVGGVIELFEQEPGAAAFGGQLGIARVV